MVDKEGSTCRCSCNSSPHRPGKCPKSQDEGDGHGEPSVFPEQADGVAGGSGHDYPHHWSHPTVKQLYCRTGYNLAIDKFGRVFGAPEAYNSLAIMEFISVAPGEVQIRSLETGLYLAMNKDGKLYGGRNSKEEGTIFVENYDRRSGYNNYLSRKYAHHGWYVGIKKSGRYKPGPKTAYGQKAIMFLPRQPKPSGSI